MMSHLRQVRERLAGTTRMPLSGLRMRLLLLVLAAVLPALLLMLLAAQEQRQLAVADILSDTERLVALATLQEQELIDTTRQLLVALAELPDLRSGDATRCTALLSDLLPRYTRYLNLGLIDARGYVLCSAIPHDDPVYAGDRAYFLRAIETRDFSIGDYQIGRITGAPSLNFGYPVHDDAGQVRGVVFAAVDYRWLSEVEAETQSRLPQGSTITKIDADGIILIQYPNPAEWAGYPFPDASVAKTVRSEREGVTVGSGADGIPRVYAFAPLQSALHGVEVFLIIGVPEEAAFGPTRRHVALNLLGVGFASALAVAAAWIGGDRFVLRHVRALVNASERVAAGDLSARTGLPHGDTEHEQLGLAFDRMAESLQQREEERDRAEEALSASVRTLQQTLKGAVSALAATAKYRDPYTAGHQERVTALACAIAEDMGLPDARIDGLRVAGHLHDLGKIALPAEVLTKPSRLTQNETLLVRTHVRAGYEILKTIDFPWPVAEIVLQHHERMDGSGYPQGLADDAILLEARILAVADVVEAMASHRPYRPALGIEKALDEISVNKGILFDAAVVDTCLKLITEGLFDLGGSPPLHGHPDS
jgi:putative nucleotidyltransferase with HDIG domain